MTDDIRHILASWPFDPDDDLAVRIIEGETSPKLQMRIDLGVIQMELDGSPSGEHPEGYESWFEYYEQERKNFESNNINDFFSLTEEDCEKLRREALHYYYRYLSLMKLGDYPRVIRDTNRNYRLFLFIKKHAANEIDRWSLDQYRPYVIMMNTRAMASLTIEKDNDSRVGKAIEYIDEGIVKITGFYKEYGLTSEMENSVELTILKALKAECLKNLPLSLEDQLTKAIQNERFEDAVQIRDLLRSRHKKN
jgi:hypothetical protein